MMTTSPTRHAFRSLLFFCCASLLLSAACDFAGQPRELPTPTFHAADLFPHLERAKTDPQPAADDFESQIEQLLAGDEPNTDAAPARATQLVPLGAALMAELPDDHDQWRWSRQNDTTLISFIPAGQEAPELLILAKNYPFLASQTPSLAFYHFLNDADPTLTQPLNIADLIEKAAQGQLPIAHLPNSAEPIPVDDLLNQLIGSTTLTGRRGLGFRSHHKSFSGWRHIGKNPAGLFLRLSTAHGTWGPQPTLPDDISGQDLQQILAAAAQNSDKDLQVSIPSPPDNQPPSRPAHLYLGLAETSPSQGVYLAIICAADAQCPQATHIAHLLDRLHPTDAPPSRKATDHDHHLSLLGLHIN